MNTESSHIDELTGVYNRRYLREKQEEDIKTLISKNVPFSIVMVDIDHFKEINDVHGHLKGDEILKEFSIFLKRALRVSDAVIRYGGDEFVCVMPSTLKHDAEMIYRRILKNCKKQKFAGLKMTMSAGISSYPDDGEDFEGLLNAADQALYEAKRSGRDTIGIRGAKKAELPIKVFIDRVGEKEEVKKVVLASGIGVRAVVVEGNVGIGKTRLCKEVLNDTEGKEIVWADCMFFTENITYYSIREIIKYRIQRWGMATLKDLAPVYRIEIGKLVPEVLAEHDDQFVGIDSVLDKYRLYEGVRKVIDVGDREKIIVVDNTQWIDQESLEVIKYLMRSLKEKPITFILIHRAEEKTKILKDFLTIISRETAVTTTELSPLEYQDIKATVKSVIGDEPRKNLVDYVAQESGGNPFYIEEIMRGLLDGRYLSVEENKWLFRAPEKEVVPKALTDIIEKKYSSLSQEAQNILEIASVIGWFDIPILKDITGFNEGHIMGLINDIDRLGMIKYVQEKFEFSEAISRNSIYEKHVTGLKAMELHRQVAERIEAQSRGKESEVLEELAFHYYRGQEKVKGVKYCVEAANRARDKYANQQAIRYYSSALKLLGDEKATEAVKTKIDCMLKKAEVLMAIGESRGALEELEKGLSISLTIGDKKREADIVLQKAKVYNRLSQFKNAIKHAEKCKEVYEELGDRNLAGSSINSSANAHFMLGQFEKGLTLYEESLTIFRETKNIDGEARALLNICNVNVKLGRSKRTFEIGKEALKIFRERGKKVEESSMLNTIAVAHYNLGEFRRALEFYEDALKIAVDVGHKHSEIIYLLNIGGIYRELGDYPSALQFYQDSIRMLRETGEILYEAGACIHVGEIYGEQGEYTNALRSYEDALEKIREIGNRDDEALVLSNIGTIYRELGDYPSALKYYKDSLEIAKKLDYRLPESAGLAGLATTCYYLGDYQKALKHYKDAQKIIEQIGDVKKKSDILLCLAELYVTQGEMKKAKESIDEAYTFCKDTDSNVIRKDISFSLCEFYLIDENLKECEKTLNDIDGLVSKIKSKRFEGDVNLLRGRYYTKMKDYDKASEYLHKALEIFEELKEKLNIGETYYYVGRMEFERGKKAASRKTLKESLNIFSSIGAKSWIEKTKKSLKDLK